MRKNAFNTSFSASAVFILTAAVCLTAPLPAQEIEYAGGVRYVHNGDPVRGGTTGAELEFVRQIGRRIDSMPPVELSYPFDVGVDRVGSLYIVEAGRDRILTFDPAGCVKASFGHEGTEPGEFSTPVSIDIDTAGLIYIGDRDNNRLQVLSADGSFIAGFAGGGDIAGVRVLRSGGIVIGSTIDFSYFGDVSFQEKNYLVTIRDRNGAPVVKLGKPLVYTAGSVTVADRSFRFATDRFDNIYLTYTHRNLIEKYTPEGKLVMRIDRPLPYGVTQITLNKGENLLGSERPHYVSRGIDIDGKDRLWVITYHRQPAPGEIGSGKNPGDLLELEIFSSGGILLGRIPLETVYDHIRIFGARVFLIDSLRGMYIREYRIVEP